jgi:WhiB family transcriptional regulator, redox-sensing transcriptional regulator
MTGTLELPQPLAPLTFDPQQANCRGLDPDLFHPRRGDSPSVRAAITVCNGCEVRGECLQYALDNNIRDGVWGGTSGRERRQMRATTRGTPAPVVVVFEHGTHGGYQRHRKAGEAACWECAQAYRDYVQDYRTRKRERRNRARGVA